MNLQSKNNAKQALSNLKMEIANELGYNYDSINDKVESNAPQGTLESSSQNVLAGENFGGMMTRSLVEKGEEILLNQYNSQTK